MDQQQKNRTRNYAIKVFSVKVNNVSATTTTSTTTKAAITTSTSGLATTTISAITIRAGTSKSAATTTTTFQMQKSSEALKMKNCFLSRLLRRRQLIMAFTSVVAAKVVSNYLMIQ